jgi:hypothetical protein
MLSEANEIGKLKSPTCACDCEGNNISCFFIHVAFDTIFQAFLCLCMHNNNIYARNVKVKDIFHSVMMVNGKHVRWWI